MKAQSLVTYLVLFVNIMKALAQESVSYRTIHAETSTSFTGKRAHSFTVAGAEAYRKDVPGTEVHILDAGHSRWMKQQLR